MIKILKKGTRQKLTCDECGCYFSYETEDIKIINECDCVDCPQCGRTIPIPAKREDGLQVRTVLLNGEYSASSNTEMGDL